MTGRERSYRRLRRLEWAALIAMVVCWFPVAFGHMTWLIAWSACFATWYCVLMVRHADG